MKDDRHHSPLVAFKSLVVLALLAGFSALDAAGKSKPIADKTLVAWVSPANLTQKGGSVLTIEKPGGVFDAIVLGEVATGKWMAGSDFYKRTQRKQNAYPVETADPQTTVQVAIVYQGKEITIYRDGKKVAEYTAGNAEKFGEDSFAVIGLRHLAAQPKETIYFTGTIEDARIYDRALDAQTIASLQANQASDPKPAAWWDFENGSAADRIGIFATSTLVGNASVSDGKLHLAGPGAYLVANRESPQAVAASAGSAGDLNRQARALREKLLADPHRPGYHFVTPEGSCMPFDPNGAIFWKGRYHLFYIFQDHRGHNWGHVSSTDLFHWRHHPTGLLSGMFSGNCFINKDGRPTMCYHQVGQGNAMAVAVDDDLDEWVKLDTNPITPRTQPGDPHHGKYRSWDPYGWLEEDTYYAIFGGKRAAIAKAPTLEGEWKYVGDLLANTVGGIPINEDISCADFFKLGDRHMLLCISHSLGCRYYLGDWKNEQFHPTFHEKMSWVDHTFFAPESLLDDRGRRIMWSWAMDLPGFKTRTPEGWSGTMSLPRVLSLAADGTLRMSVPEEIERLRYNARKMENLTVSPGPGRRLEGIQGNSLELLLEVDMNDAAQFGVKVCQSPQGEEETVVFYDAGEKKLKADTRKSSLGDGTKSVEAGPFALKEGERLQLRIFVDKSVVEVFANDRQAVMRRIYPSRDDSLGVSLFSEGGTAQVKSVRAWDLMPSNAH